MTTTGRRVRITLTVLAAAMAVVAILLSPLGLRAFDGTSGIDWNRLSQIGQTYGAASALVSAFALGGVALSLFIQTRQARADQIHAIRSIHHDLVRMELDDLELYLPCWGPLNLPSAEEKKRHIYTTLMMDYAWMGYEIGSTPEPLLRDMLGGMFAGRIARRHWATARNAWVAAPHGSRRGREFLQIVDDEYDKAITSGPPEVSDLSEKNPQPAAADHRRDWQTAAGALIGIVGGAVAMRAFRHHRSH